MSVGELLILGLGSSQEEGSSQTPADTVPTPHETSGEGSATDQKRVSGQKFESAEVSVHVPSRFVVLSARAPVNWISG